MENLSSFHDELYSFMQSKVRDRAVDEDELGIAKEFEIDLENRAIPLEKIVSQYNQLFDPLKWLQIERLWINSFNESEFIELGLEKYFPKIYRGLPRYYARDDASESHLKPNFTTLSDLRWLSVDRAVFSLYEGKATKKRNKIGIFTWVIADGLGDWVAAQEAAHILKAKMPWLEIHLFPVSQREILPSPDFKTHFSHYEVEPLPDLLNEMDFVLQLPTFFQHADRLPFAQSMESLGEYGYMESSWFHPKSGNRSMGLHALEKGIFIRKSKQASFAEIEQKNLLQLLFNTELPGPAEIDSYEQKIRFHVGYLSTPIGGAIYLHSLLKMWKRDEKDIDICSPDPNWFIEFYEMREKEGKALLEESYGVKQIIVLWANESRTIALSQTGKTVRILCPGVLSSSDMQKLIALSGEWVGVRGNQSLSEAISAGKAFFYDGRDHSRYLIKDLIAMAENRLSGYKSSLHAFRMIGQAFLWNRREDTEVFVEESHFQLDDKMPWYEIATELGLSLQDSDCIAGFKKYCRICEEERSVGPFICHLVERALFHLERPDVKAKEKQLSKLFGEGKIAFSTLVKNLRVHIPWQV